MLTLPDIGHNSYILTHSILITTLTVGFYYYHPQKGGVLVSPLGLSYKMPQTECLRQQKLFSHAFRGWKSKTEVSVKQFAGCHFGSSEASPLGCRWLFLHTRAFPVSSVCLNPLFIQGHGSDGIRGSPE